jgi:hypothetical protein
MATDENPKPEQELDAPTKQRILLEERYRAEVQKQLRDEKPESSSLWSFLNSSFGLWLLSAIFITGVSGAFTWWQHDHDLKRAADDKKVQEQKVASQAEAVRVATLLKLDREISFRLSSMLEKLRVIASTRAEIGLRIKDSGEAATEEDKADMLQTTADLEAVQKWLRTPTDTDEHRGLYPELAAYTLPALVSQLRNLVPVNQQKELDSLLETLASLQLHYKPNDPIMFSSYILALLKPRWSGFGFPMTRCAPDDIHSCFGLSPLKQGHERPVDLNGPPRQ